MSGLKFGSDLNVFWIFCRADGTEIDYIIIAELGKPAMVQYVEIREAAINDAIGGATGVKMLRQTV